MFGCGFHGFEGKASAKYEKGARSAPVNRTCPQFCARQPDVQAVLSDVRDYKRGSLGCVLDMDAPRLEALRAAEDEQAAWESDLYDIPSGEEPS